MDYIKMTRDEFDNYICSKYPEMFRERNLPMSETCMCWGFEVGKGWYATLALLFKNIDLITKSTGIKVIFTQIKEKFGSGRFYYRIDLSECKLGNEEIDCWSKVIDDIISRAEDSVGGICSECGKQYFHGNIVTGFWVHDMCDKCFISKKHISDKMNQEEINQVVAENAKLVQRYKDVKNDASIAKGIIHGLNDEVRSEVMKYLKSKQNSNS